MGLRHRLVVGPLQRGELPPRWNNDTTKAINYCLSRLDAFSRFLDDGRLCTSNNAAERELRAVAVGRKNWTFALLRSKAIENLGRKLDLDRTAADLADCTRCLIPRLPSPVRSPVEGRRLAALAETTVAIVAATSAKRHVAAPPPRRGAAPASSQGRS
jgi:hypothetical protein